ncbi:MAG: class I SAM-dependent methyltransferase [Rhodospirillales bacterium]
MSGQRWDTGRYARDARFVSDLGLPVVALLAPAPGERILDLGCGDGTLTEAIAAAGARVVGVDASSEMAAAARARGLEVRVLDAARLPFAAAFDAVFTNAALHWMGDLRPVVAGVRRALVDGGRFVGETGGHGNVAAVRWALTTALRRRDIDPAAHDPWVFPSPSAFRAILEGEGLRIAMLTLRPRPTLIPGTLADWLQTFAGRFLDALPPTERPAVVAEVEETLAPFLRDDAGRWTVDYVRLRFAAVKR